MLGIEARGFIFGPALAYRLNAGFVPVRKPKKLPAEVLQWKYELEYGTTRWKSTKTPSSPASASSSATICWLPAAPPRPRPTWPSQLGGNICGLGFVVELDGLKGRDKLKDYDVFSLLHYEM